MIFSEQIVRFIEIRERNYSDLYKSFIGYYSATLAIAAEDTSPDDGKQSKILSISIKKKKN